MDISVKLEPEDCTVLEGLHACGNVDDRTVELLVKEEPTTWVVAEASDAEASVTMEVSDESSKASIKELTEPLKMGNEAIMDDNFEVSHIATVKVKPIDEGKIQPDLQTITMEQGLLRKRNKEQDIKYELLDTCSVTCCSESESKNHFNEVMLMVSLQENDRNNEQGSPHSPCQNVLVPLALRQSSKRGRNQHERRDDKITDQEKEEDEEMESLPIHFQSESLASCGKTSSKSSLSKHQQCDVCLELLSEEMKLIVHRRNQVSIQHCNTAASESQMKPRALSRVLRKPYKCRSYLPSCPVTFSTKDKLQKHTLPHKSSCPINCSICQKLFFFEGQLGQHVKIHEHLQHLQCEHCPETLQNSSEDKYHKGQMHSIKSFQCNPKMAQEHRGKTCSPCETVPSTVICASKWITQKIPHVSLKSFQCGSCSAEFPTYKLLKVHCRNHQAQVLDSKGKISSKPKTHKCPHCEVQFQAGKNLTSHMKVHSQIKPYKCNHCSAAFVRHSDLKRHLKTHSGEKDFKCDLCHSAFADSCKLKIHMRIHTGERPYKCELCPEAFSQSSQFERHKRVHNGDKPYKCQHCPSAFTMTSDYRRHQKIHSGERPFMCEYCPACFPEAKNLRIHMRTHTGEKPYKCELCPAAFAQAANLKRHMKSHTGERPAKCELCPSAFPDSHKLRVHMRSHNGDKPYKCKLCSSTFATSSALNRHIIVHSGEKPFKCEQCPASFAHMSKLKHHEICHSNKGSFKCEQCTASFYNVHGLTVHSHLHD